MVDPSPSLQTCHRAFSESGDSVPSVLKRSAKVRAAVCDGEDLSIQVSSDQNGQAVDFNRNKISGSDIVRLENSDPFLLWDK